MKFYYNIGFFILKDLMGLSSQTVKKQDWTESSWPHNVYNGKFSVKTRVEHGFGIEYMYFQWL